MNKKTLRIIIGIVFLVFLVISFVPNIYLSSSGDGLINARTVTLRSPIEGHLYYFRPTICGSVFTKGEKIGKVLNHRANRSFLYELMTEKRTLETRISVMNGRLKEYAVLKQHLENNLRKYKSFFLKKQEEQIRQIKEKLTQEEAECSRAEKQYQADSRLLNRDVLKRRDFETSEASYLKSKAKIRELKNMLSEAKNGLDAIQAGVFLGDGHNDVPYSSQRLDQLVIETCLAKAAKNEAEHRITGIDLQIATEQKRLEQMELFTFDAPFQAEVWRLTTPEGSTVVIDSPLVVLLDCSSVFLDIVLSESQSSDIKAGDTIRYRLIGESNYHRAKVFALHGSGAKITDENLAAHLYKDPKKDFHIWATIDPSDIDLRPDNFYQVGHRVQVKINRKWNFGREIVRFFNVF